MHTIHTHLETTNACQKDRIRVAALLKSLFGKWIVLLINRNSSDKSFLQFQLKPTFFAESGQNLLGSLCNFGADPIAGQESDRIGILLGNGIQCRMSCKGWLCGYKRSSSSQEEHQNGTREFHLDAITTSVVGWNVMVMDALSVLSEGGGGFSQPSQPRKDPREKDTDPNVDQLKVRVLTGRVMNRQA